VDKDVTFAVAGSGKTRSIVEGIDPARRSVILTYTTNTERDLTKRIAERLGGLPDTITVWTYFAFLNRFCYKPLLQADMRSRGISFDSPSKESSRVKTGQRSRYMHGDQIYHCRMAKLLVDKGCMPALMSRVERYYDDVFVDEVQDFGGHDFNFLLALSKTNARFKLVGDFHQHTFSTSHDGNVNISLHDDYAKYRERFANSGFHVDTTSLSASHRSTQAVCDSIGRWLGISIASARESASHVRIVDTQAEVDQLHADPAVVKLFRELHWLYGCHSHNWGACKGLDHYQDVCVVLDGKSWARFERGELAEGSSVTRNKLYVAFSRARGNLFLAPERLFKKHRLAA
jgi:DNA helicase II / ATP-dependent DNA helicase PcrA